MKQLLCAPLALALALPLTAAEPCVSGLPVGKRPSPQSAKILDEDGAECPVGVAGTIFIYGGGASVPKPRIEGDVHFLAAPVESAPPKRPSLPSLP